MEDINKKIEEIQKRWQRASEKRAGVAGQLSAKKEELSALIQQIKDAGYDPKDLPAARDALRLQLDQAIQSASENLDQVEAALKDVKI